MTSFYVGLALVAACGLLWLLPQLGRLTGTPRLAALAGLVVFWAISWPFGIVANSGTMVLGLDRLHARTIEHGFRLVATACLLAFVLATPGPRRLSTGLRIGRTWWWQAGALLLALVALAVTTAWTPGELRDQLAAMANGDAVSTSPVGSTPIALFFLIENTYYFTTFTIAAFWVTRHLRCDVLPPALRRGLRLFRLGSVILVAATTMLTLSVLWRWAGMSPPSALTGIGLVLLSLGLLAVVLGLAAPAASSIAVSIRIMRENRATSRALDPLWTQLQEAFPPQAPRRDDGFSGRVNYTACLEHATAPPIIAWVSRRYYRKLIECRDGLHKLSPYLQKVARGGQSPLDLPTGPQLLAALDLRRTETLDHPGAPIVGPADDVIEADIQVLTHLSQRLAVAHSISAATTP